MLRRLKIAVWGLLIAGAALAGLTQLGWISSGGLPRVEVTIGGPFELTDHNGNRFSSKSLEGRPFAIFFGFTSCPDVCPTTLLEMSNQLKRLGPAADQLTVIFMSVDSERDTPSHLKAYLANFDHRIVGLVGSEQEVRAVAKSYYAFYEKVPTSTGYTINHTASVYLMGRDGRYRGAISYHEPEAHQLAKLRRLMEGNP
ncbi:MAG: SCO family protein [Hyphomicrobiaceae bacterium]|nr:MAG: SCO family protein [Hyphomicrobiaceae bacterium]